MALLSFMLGPIGRVLIYAAVALGAVTAFALYFEHKGAVRIVHKIEVKNKESVHVADQTRQKVLSLCARNPLPAQCVRDGWTRDN